MLPFSKFKYLLDTLIQKILLHVTKINNFRGELIDMTAKKEVLLNILTSQASHDRQAPTLWQWAFEHGFGWFPPGRS